MTDAVLPPSNDNDEHRAARRQAEAEYLGRQQAQARTAAERIETERRIALLDQSGADGAPEDVSIHAAILRAFADASATLLRWSQNTRGVWLSRPELDAIRDRIEPEQGSVQLLLGEPGSGKSALLAALANRLMSDGIPVLAIKADRLPRAINGTMALYGSIAGAPLPPERALRHVASGGPVVLILDQLDALASLVDLHSDRLNILLDLVHALANTPNLHIVASSRSFEHQHDPRLRTIEADLVRLAAPSWEEVDALLGRHGYDTRRWPVDVRNLLQIPQHLRTFLDLRFDTGEVPPYTTHIGMLEALWRQYVTPFPERRELIGDLAGLLSEQEELWVAEVCYEDRLSVIEALLGANVLIRDQTSHSIGFRHQTLLEYARARSFLTREGSLADYAMRLQGALFCRPHVWNGLKYLRETDRRAYWREFYRLWSDRGLRPHLRRLLEEFLSQLDDPGPEEIRVFVSLLDDPERRSRLLELASVSGWFSVFDAKFSVWMGDGQPRGLIRLLGRALPQHTERVTHLIEAHWLDSDEQRYAALEVMRGNAHWNDRLLGLMESLLERTEVNWMALGSWWDSLLTHRPGAFPKLLRLHLMRREAALRVAHPRNPPPNDQAGDIAAYARWRNDDLHTHLGKLIQEEIHTDERLDRVVERASRAILDELLPWYRRVLSEIIDPDRRPDVYPGDWRDGAKLKGDDRYDPKRNSLTQLLEGALQWVMQNDLDYARKLVGGLVALELMPVQRMLARAFAECLPEWSDEAFAFVLGDTRRLALGSWDRQAGDSVRLIKCLFVTLEAEKQGALIRLIATYRPFQCRNPQDYELASRRRFAAYERDYRARLWQAIPLSATPRFAWRQRMADEREFDPDDASPRDVRLRPVESWMKPQQMAKACNAHLLAPLHCFDDSAPHDQRRFPMSDANRSLTASLKELAKIDPERAITLSRHFRPRSDENAMGHVFWGIGESELPSEQLYQFFREAHARGFRTPGFRDWACHALSNRANHDAPLPEDLIPVVAEWIDRNPSNVDVDEEKKSRETSHGSVLFQHHMMIMSPEGNYPVLTLLTRAYLLRESVMADQWMNLLEEQLPCNDGADVWRVFGLSWFGNLHLCDHERATVFLTKLFAKRSEVLASMEGAIVVNYAMRWAPQEQVAVWLDALRASDWAQGAQAAGELLYLYLLWFPDDVGMRDQIDTLLDTATPSDNVVVQQRIGLAFTAMEAWGEAEFREVATTDLLKLLALDDAEVAKALDGLLFRIHHKPFDRHTVRILDAIAEHPEVLRGGRVNGLLDDLESEASGPYAEVVYRICRAYLEVIGTEVNDMRSAHGMNGRHITAISFALQRQANRERREQGLDLFERLMALEDSSAHGALTDLDRRWG